MFCLPRSAGPSDADGWVSWGMWGMWLYVRLCVCVNVCVWGLQDGSGLVLGWFWTRAKLVAGTCRWNQVSDGWLAPASAAVSDTNHHVFLAQKLWRKPTVTHTRSFLWKVFLFKLVWVCGNCCSEVCPLSKHHGLLFIIYVSSDLMIWGSQPSWINVNK